MRLKSAVEFAAQAIHIFDAVGNVFTVFPDAGEGESAPDISLSLTFMGGPVVNVWATGDTLTAGRTDGELRLQLQPDQPVVIGRQQGGEIEYLDPQYRPTQSLPACSDCIFHGRH